MLVHRLKFFAEEEEEEELCVLFGLQKCTRSGRKEHLLVMYRIRVSMSIFDISGVIITFIPALGSYLTPDLLGGTDSQMIANVIERQFKSANDWPFGAALSFLLIYLTFFALAVRALLTRHNEEGLT